jgi:hypothetical protein
MVRVKAIVKLSMMRCGQILVVMVCLALRVARVRTILRDYVLARKLSDSVMFLLSKDEICIVNE